MCAHPPPRSPRGGGVDLAAAYVGVPADMLDAASGVKMIVIGLLRDQLGDGDTRGNDAAACSRGHGTQSVRRKLRQQIKSMDEQQINAAAAAHPGVPLATRQSGKPSARPARPPARPPAPSPRPRMDTADSLQGEAPPTGASDGADQGGRRVLSSFAASPTAVSRPEPAPEK